MTWRRWSYPEKPVYSLKCPTCGKRVMPEQVHTCPQERPPTPKPKEREDG